MGIAGPESRRKGHLMDKEKKAELEAISVLLKAGWVMVPGGVLLPPRVENDVEPRSVKMPRKNINTRPSLHVSKTSAGKVRP